QDRKRSLIVGRGGGATAGPPPPATFPLAEGAKPGLSNTRYKHKKEK
ncbi:hypothetical protein AVDCRST_MAG84-6404, partial [uncultured Microcoleus sp.]